MQRLRTAIKLCIAAQALVYIFLYYNIWKHTHPMGDGMEWVAVVPALFLAGLSAAPGLLLSVINRLLIPGALWAVAGAILNLAFYTEVASELAHPR